MTRALAVVAVVLLASGPARLRAEEPAEPAEPAEPEVSRPLGGLTFGIAGGVGIPVGSSAKPFAVGSQLEVTVGYRVIARLIAQAEYGIGLYNVTADIVQERGYTASHIFQHVNLGVQVDLLPPGGRVALYLVGGPGLYGRTVEVADVSGGNLEGVCDPSLLVCTTSPYESASAKRTLFSFGVDAGIGASVSLGDPVQLFIEARLHLMWDSIDTPSGTRSANGNYLPVTIGFRYF